jgi:hypothetical protein
MQTLKKAPQDKDFLLSAGARGCANNFGLSPA